MRRVLTIGLLAFASGVACIPAPPPSEPSVAVADTTGARLLLTREAGPVRVAPLYDAPADPPDSLRYELEVLREGQAGRSASRQSGTFTPHPGRTDTLSVASVNVAPGDRLQIHLRLFSAERLVDEAHHDEVVSATN